MPVSPSMIYLAGISPRSGTNWLFDLIVQHPACRQARVGEDHFLYHAHLLTTYTSNLRRSWKPDWRLARDTADARILRRFGQALMAELARSQGAIEPDPERAERTTIVAKTPSPRNIRRFHDLFPESKLVVLVRDGRSVVESAMRSFDWSFDTAAGVWLDGARELLRYQAQADGEASLLVVRYEDLFADPEHELRRVLDFTGLETASYDFAGAVDIPVRGSSTYARTDDGISWKPVEKSDDFDPLVRWKEWSPGQLARFDDLGGAELEALGYTRVRPPLGAVDSMRYAVWRGSRAAVGTMKSGARQISRAVRGRLK